MIRYISISKTVSNFSVVCWVLDHLLNHFEISCVHSVSEPYVQNIVHNIYLHDIPVFSFFQIKVSLLVLMVIIGEK